MFRRPAPNDRDLGFGSVADLQRSRLLTRDGHFGVQRFGHDWRAALNAYHGLLTMSWGRFLLVAALVYIGFDVLFALAYLACGPEAVAGDGARGPFLRAFFLAVQTSTTVGYGQLAPAGTAAQLVSTVQGFGAMVLVALGTGVVFARFSRPTVDLAWSDRALVAPYGDDGRGLMLRIANRRPNQVFDLQARLMLVLDEPGDGPTRQRQFHPLDLERQKVSFFPLSWTIVHPIEGDSPLHDVTPEEFLARRGEVIVLLQGRDATTSQDVHAWCSYTADEVVFGARFVPIFEAAPDGGPIRMDVDRVHEYERAAV